MKQINYIDHENIKFYSDKRVLVTGGTGYLGSRFISELISSGCELKLLVRKSSKLNESYIKNPKVKIIVGDLNKKNTWEKTLDGINYIFHFAARENKYGVFFDPYQDLLINIVPTLLMLEVCRKNGYPVKILFSGSENQLGIANKIPVDETNIDKPVNIFGINKLTSEKYLELYSNDFGIKSVTLRLSNVYGPTSELKNLLNVSLNKIISDALAGSIYILNNGLFIRDYVYIDDVINAFLISGRKMAELTNSFYYIGSESGSKLNEVMSLICNLVEEKIGKRPSIIKKLSKIKETPFEMRNFVSDTIKFQSDTGWQSQVPLIDGIKRTIDFIQNSRNII